MPNAKVLESKKAVVANLSGKIKEASSVVFVDYKGITVENMERFIAAVDDKEQSYKKEYNRVCAYAQAMGKKKAYAIVAGWFVEQFPKYRTEPFYYFNNHPTLIPFQPSNNKENSEPELAATGTGG